VSLHESLVFSGEKAPDAAGAFIFKPAGQGTDWLNEHQNSAGK
jgi:hypothetical protein